MARKPLAIPQVCSANIAVCEHDHVHIEFFDGAGRRLCEVVMDADRAHDFAVRVEAAVDEALA